MADFQIVWHEAALFEVLHDAELAAEVLHDAELVAETARTSAPRGKGKQGHGADTIHAELVGNPALGEVVARVSWDQLHAYMRFPDRGTRYQPAQHFLEHAADRYATG